MNSQSWKCGKAISPFLSDQITYIKIFIFIALHNIMALHSLLAMQGMDSLNHLFQFEARLTTVCLHSAYLRAWSHMK